MTKHIHIHLGSKKTKDAKTPQVILAEIKRQRRLEDRSEYGIEDLMQMYGLSKEDARVLENLIKQAMNGPGTKDAELSPADKDKAQRLAKQAIEAKIQMQLNEGFLKDPRPNANIPLIKSNVEKYKKLMEGKIAQLKSMNAMHLPFASELSRYG